MTLCSDSFRLAGSNDAKIRWIIQKPTNKEIPTQILAELTKKRQMDVKFYSKINVKLGIYDNEETILAVLGGGDFADLSLVKQPSNHNFGKRLL